MRVFSSTNQDGDTATGRRRLVSRFAVIGAVAGFGVSLPLWWGAYQFGSAKMYSLTTLSVVTALVLPVAYSGVVIAMGLLGLRLDEWLRRRRTRPPTHGSAP